MPIYEYQCQSPKCRHTFDALQKMSARPISICPKCKGKKVQKLISASSFILKGSGWYQTTIGSLKDKDKMAAAESSAGSKPAEVKAESKAETKTEAKVEAKPAPKPEAARKSSAKPSTAKKRKPAA